TSGIEHFQNIRYAKAPTGSLRFAPPEPYSHPTNRIIDATAAGSACPQSKAAMPPFLAEVPEISEDCLNLRIARPEGTKEGDKLPVVVWVHAGGVLKGSAYDPHFVPDILVQRSVELGKPVLYVAINYRLTIFGFARLAKLEKEKSLNVGMRDQRMAFEWVRQNIAAFGGDPESVTAFGLSAGGTTIGLQMVAYGGEHGVPFDRAWMMSGPPGTAVNMSSDAAVGHTLAVAERLECNGDDEEQLQCLRDVPMEKLLDVAMEYSVQNFPPAGLFTFIPCVDGDMFPESATKLYRERKFAKGIPTVLGWTQNDGAMQTGPPELITSEADIAATIRVWAPDLTPSEMSALFEMYATEDFTSAKTTFELAHPENSPISLHRYRLSQIMRDILFTCPSIEFANHNAQFPRDGQQEDGKSFEDVYLYVLNQTMLTPLFDAFGMSHLGVCHGSDTNYIFNGVFPEGEVLSKDKELASEFSAKLIEFA
ncbi:alpha/beta-hydrolase, partial [Lophiostoma macrostomum CBS 122681]